MPSTATLTAYIQFLQWFRKQYPEMFRLYWKNITAPSAGGEVSIDATGLDALVFIQLMELQFEYYHPRGGIKPVSTNMQ